MTSQPRPQPPVGDDDRGASLIELMVSLLLLGIVLAIAVGTLTQLLRANQNANQRLQDTSDAQVVMDSITRLIRTATPSMAPAAPIQYAGPNELTFYATTSAYTATSGPILIDLTLSGTTLTETQWPAVPGSGGVGWTFAATPSHVQTLATDIDPGHGPLFTYYPVAVDPTITPSSTVSVPLSQQPNGATTAIDSVEVNLWIDPHGLGAGPAANDMAVVHLANVDYAEGLD